MAGRIPSDFIQQLLARVDLADLIGRYVPLKKAGTEFKACCPFHNEKTPSFTVSPRKGFYHCFGCGAHGTAITFLMEYCRYSFPDAIEELAKQTGLEVPRVGGSVAPRQELDPLYECMEAASQFYQKELTRSKPAQAYARERGLSDEICEEYRIGYAPPGFENLEPKLSARFSKELLLKVGLLSEKENRVYDKFRNRLMFPIRDSRGRVLGFGGRVIDPEDKPKYINSPETPLFHKGRVLYGVHELQQRRGKVNYLILTEGYMDVVSLAQAGVRNALATLGTATTEDHIRQMGRFCRTFAFCFDGDTAGRAAGWRALENLLPVLREGDEVRFAHLPEGEDPDSYIRAHGTSGWKEFIRGAVPLEDYFFTHLEQGLNLGLASGKSALVAKARPLLEKVGALGFPRPDDPEAVRHDRTEGRSIAPGTGGFRPDGCPTPQAGSAWAAFGDTRDDSLVAGISWAGPLGPVAGRPEGHFGSGVRFVRRDRGSIEKESWYYGGRDPGIVPGSGSGEASQQPDALDAGRIVRGEGRGRSSRRLRAGHAPVQAPAGQAANRRFGSQAG